MPFDIIFERIFKCIFAGSVCVLAIMLIIIAISLYKEINS